MTSTPYLIRQTSMGDPSVFGRMLRRTELEETEVAESPSLASSSDPGTCAPTVGTALPIPGSAG